MLLREDSRSKNQLLRRILGSSVGRSKLCARRGAGYNPKRISNCHASSRISSGMPLPVMVDIPIATLFAVANFGVLRIRLSCNRSSDRLSRYRYAPSSDATAAPQRLP